MSSTKGDVVCETKEEDLLVPIDLVEKTVGVAVDMGASMLKIVFRSKENLEETADKNADFGHLQLVSFPRDRLHDGLDYVAKRCALSRSVDDRLPITICTTGTGGWEFRKTISQKLNVRVKSIVEFECFANAFIYLASHASRNQLLHPYDDEAAVGPTRAMKEYVQVLATMHRSSEAPTPDSNCGKELDFSGSSGKLIGESNEPIAEAEEIYPCLLAICGSAFTYILINKDKTFKYIDYSSRGGRGFHGLGSLLTGCKTFDELLELASNGNQQNVDIFTNALFPTTDDKTEDDTEDGNLYVSLSRMTNPGLVYCFGKAAGARLEDFRREDLASACLNYAVNDFVQQLFALSRLHSVGRIFLCGSFCNSPLVRRAVTAELVRKNLNATLVKAQIVSFDFIKSGPHLGALGALISAMPISSNHSEDESSKEA